MKKKFLFVSTLLSGLMVVSGCGSTSNEAGKSQEEVISVGPITQEEATEMILAGQDIGIEATVTDSYFNSVDTVIHTKNCTYLKRTVRGDVTLIEYVFRDNDGNLEAIYKSFDGGQSFDHVADDATQYSNILFYYYDFPFTNPAENQQWEEIEEGKEYLVTAYGRRPNRYFFENGKLVKHIYDEKQDGTAEQINEFTKYGEPVTFPLTKAEVIAKEITKYNYGTVESPISVADAQAILKGVAEDRNLTYFTPGEHDHVYVVKGILTQINRTSTGTWNMCMADTEGETDTLKFIGLNYLYSVHDQDVLGTLNLGDEVVIKGKLCYNSTSTASCGVFSGLYWEVLRYKDTFDWEIVSHTPKTGE